MLIVSTDHGFFAGRTPLVGKGCMPAYNEPSSYTFIYMGSQKKMVMCGQSLVGRTLDLRLMILDFFGVDIPERHAGYVLATRLLPMRYRFAGRFILIFKPA